MNYGSTPVGSLKITHSSSGITSLTLTSGRSGQSKRSAAAVHLRQIDEYFAGQRTRFSLPLDLRQGTAFQRKVWSALATIPYGQTLTYGELASRIGKPRAVRAVASAVARNPVAIVVPCHRVVPKSGPQPGKPARTAKWPGGFAWGTERKKWLLEHERKATEAAEVAEAKEE